MPIGEDPVDEFREMAIDRLRALAGQRAPSLAGREAVLVGLAGRGIQASRSPIMHEREGARLGIPFRYVLIDFDALGLKDSGIGAIVRAAAELGFAGLNITHPFKQTVIPVLDELSPEAQSIGAVNTVVIRDGRCIGHNTDSWGFAESLRQARPALPIGRVVQFGAGGAGAAVAQALDGLGVGELVIIDSAPERAEALAARLGRRSSRVFKASRAVEEEIGRAEGIVNATPVGMANYPGTPFPLELLSARHWVADIVYFPEDTELLRAARAAGCRTVPGSGMAVYQAVRAFELFTGARPDASAMTEHFQAA
jgi:shikimate dehydrogenase